MLKLGIDFNALRRKLKLTDYFENKQNFAPVFLEISKFRPFWKADFRKTIIATTFALF